MILRRRHSRLKDNLRAEDLVGRPTLWGMEEKEEKESVRLGEALLTSSTEAPQWSSSHGPLSGSSSAASAPSRLAPSTQHMSCVADPKLALP